MILTEQKIEYIFLQLSLGEKVRPFLDRVKILLFDEDILVRQILLQNRGRLCTRL